MNFFLKLLILSSPLFWIQSGLADFSLDNSCSTSLVTIKTPANGVFAEKELEAMAVDAANAVFVRIRNFALAAEDYSDAGLSVENRFLLEKEKIERQLQWELHQVLDKRLRQQYSALRISDNFDSFLRSKWGMLWIAATAGISPTIAVIASTFAFYIHGDYLLAATIPTLSATGLLTFFQLYDNAESRMTKQGQDLGKRLKDLFESSLYQLLANNLKPTVMAQNGQTSEMLKEIPKNNILLAIFHLFHKEKLLGQNSYKP